MIYYHCVHFLLRRPYCKIPKISPSKYKPPGGLYLEVALKYKVKQSKNGTFPFHYKLPQSILKPNFPLYMSPSKNKPLKSAFEKYKPRGLFLEFYGSFLEVTFPF